MNLRIENIKHNFGAVHFHYNADISDSITGIFGFSGSGKTTLMNIIGGIETPKSGHIAFNNRVLFDRERKINLPENKRNIGIVFQDNYLFPHLNVQQNLLYSKPYVKDRKQVITFNTVVELLDIEPLLNKKPLQLSGGERQRVAIGRTLLSQPELLLMDEPFSNLDRNRRKQIISYLLKINNQFGIPLLIISHDLEDILKLTRSFLIINNGEVLAAGNYLDIADRGAAPDIISHKRYINILELYHTSYQEDENLNFFSTEKNLSKPLLKTNSNWFSNKQFQGRKVRLCIYPDDIALNGEPIENTSIQNQLKGIVSKIRYKDNSCFVTVDCGVDLVAEVTDSSVKKMQIEIGRPVYCLIKAKAIEVIHIFKD